MKIYLLINLLSLGQLAFSQSVSLNEQKKFLKDYAFCQCIVKGFHKDTLFKKDASRGFYAEMLKYDIEKMDKMDTLVHIYLHKNSIRFNHPEYKGKNFVMATCINFYNSAILSNTIYSLYSKRKKG